MDTTSAPGPLAGRRVLVPRPPHQATELARRIRAAGGTPLLAPTIATVPGDERALREACVDLASGRLVGVCITSGNGVRALAAAADAAGVDLARALARLALLGAVGPRTADLIRETFALDPTLVPADATGAALAAAAPSGTGRVLLPRGDLAGRHLEQVLARKGWTPVPVVAYRTVTASALPPEVLDALGRGEVDLLAFTSASTVRGFLTLVGDRPWTGAVVAIGPVTAATCREFGLTVAEEAEPHDLGGLMAALERAAATMGGNGR